MLNGLNITKYDNIIFKGMTFVGDKYCPEVNYKQDDAKLSMKLLSETGANWVAIVVTEYQDYVNSSDIYPLYKDFKKSDYFIYKTEELEGIMNIAQYAKSIGLKVMLKPHIDLTEEKDPLIWRGHIGINMTADGVKKWFDSYNTFILKYAKLAQELKLEMFSISCELINMNPHSTHWRNTIKEVRKVYTGPLTISANHDGEEFNKTFWDAVDYIGVDAYYLPILTYQYRDNLTNIETIFDDTLKRLKNLSETYQKEVIITEVGFCSGNCKRNETATPYDQFLQAEFYEWFFKLFAKEKYIKGFFWWSWNSDPNYGGLRDTCISPQHKITEQILRELYGAKSNTTYVPTKAPKCICTI